MTRINAKCIYLFYVTSLKYSVFNYEVKRTVEFMHIKLSILMKQ